MFKRFYQRHKSELEKFDGLFLNNTVLERGLVIAPIIVAANTFINAYVLGMSFLLITFFTVLMASFIPKSLPYTFRVILYTLTSSVLYVPVAYYMNFFFEDSVFKVGIALPLLITNSLIVTKTETRFFRKKKWAMVLDVFSHTLGFFIVILVVGIIREFLGNASYIGQAIALPIKVNAFMLPFGGFVVLAFLAAAIQRLRIYLNASDKQNQER